MGCDLEETPQNDTFDFINKSLKILVEVKSRMNKKDKYPDTMVGDNKWKKAKKLKEDKWDIYFVFNFTDRICIYEFDNQDVSRRRGGRMDRGKREIKYYRYINIDDLEDI